MRKGFGREGQGRDVKGSGQRDGRFDIRTGKGKGERVVVGRA